MQWYIMPTPFLNKTQNYNQQNNSATKMFGTHAAVLAIPACKIQQ
jgi:hypothetical protein